MQCTCGQTGLGTHQTWCPMYVGMGGISSYVQYPTYSFSSKVDLSDETIEKLAAAIARHLALYEAEK